MTSIQSQHFKIQANLALKNSELQRALSKAKGGFIDKRLLALSQLPEFDTLRDQAKALKEHTLTHLDFYLEQFEEKVQQRGGHVHWAENADQACDIIVRLCQQVNAQLITKGKSMIGEEIGLNQALEKAGMQVMETDLGEYIIQLAKEPPSHIIAPAVHKTREQISKLFYQHHQKEGFNQPATEIADLVNQARQVLRQYYLKADVGITGANFLIAETGSTIIVTNEGNGDLTNCLPKVHIVIASLEKVVPTLNDATLLMRLLARSATGQHFTTYTTLSTGIKADSELSGAEQFHVILLDNGRSVMLGNEFREMLRCIRCGACLNHCPVYGAIGGHAYGWVYPGPMGSVLTPLMIGLKNAGDLPQACTMNGRCETVCPDAYSFESTFAPSSNDTIYAIHDFAHYSMGLSRVAMVCRASALVSLGEWRGHWVIESFSARAFSSFTVCGRVDKIPRFSCTTRTNFFQTMATKTTR
jgi:L-lactate dehydrogenase complex protein LldF